MNVVSQVVLAQYHFLTSRLEQIYEPLRQHFCNQQPHVVQHICLVTESDVMVRKLNVIQECLLLMYFKGLFLEQQQH